MSQNHLILSLLLLFATSAIAQNSENGNKLNPKELKTLVGEWEGSLTYLDYSSGKPYTMPANASIKPGKNEYQLAGAYIYPNEPKANSNFKLTISEDGKTFNKKDITSKRTMEDGNIEITTEYSGKDDNKKAQIKNIYIIGASTFKIRKEVMFPDSEDWIKRNEYSFSK